MRSVAILTICGFILGCAATPSIDEQLVVEEAITETVPEISSVPAQQDGVITKLKGVAYIHDVENEKYIALREGDRIPIGKVFYLSPKTTMKIEQNSGDELYIYSKEKERYFRLE